MEEKKLDEQVELIETFKPNETKNDWDSLGGKPKGELLNQIDEKGVIKNIDASSIRTGVLTGAKIQTNPTGARVVIGGEGDLRNDILLIDDTTGGTTPVTGNTASIKFARSDDASQVFRIQKRSGKNDNDENVVEMFYEKDANGADENYIFIGKKGDGTASDIHTDIVQVETNDVVSIGNKNNNSVPILQVGSTEAIGLNAGGTFVVISASKADTDTGYSNGGRIVINILDNESSSSGITPMIIDKDGIHLVSTNGTQIGLLGVNNSTGALQWNGIDIS